MVKDNGNARATQSIPSCEEIKIAEERLLAMKKAREDARNALLSSLSSIEEVAELLNGEDAIKLMMRLKTRIQAGHKKIKGSKVSEELKKSLEFALREGSLTLSQLTDAFHLSTSYISRVKHELGLTKPQAPHSHLHAV